MGIIHAATGEHERGVADCEQAVQKTRDPLNRAIATGFLGFACLEQGDGARALAALEQATPLLRRFGVAAFGAWFTVFLAEAHGLVGQLDRAEAVARDGLRLATATGFAVGAGWAHLVLGRVAGARGDDAAAAASYDAALEIFAATRSRYESARTHLDLAAAQRARGDVEATRRHLCEAYAVFAELGVSRYGEYVEGLTRTWGVSLAG